MPINRPASNGTKSPTVTQLVAQLSMFPFKFFSHHIDSVTFADVIHSYLEHRIFKMCGQREYHFSFSNSSFIVMDLSLLLIE